ncbi:MULTISPECIES: DUF2333 family protein [unclassified Brucella]|uniref:DUF2333 family protein n=1 Tax=unclassified Brucella TaxID=2632610 RepID=UPI0001E44487|nr:MULTISPECIES: DUF2333 family protein [unclassified Brucella]APX70308.1 hypothetical protein BKD03_13945 [Brucella sp. 09RB8471]EFM58306.1 Hypothetical protein BIBO2_2839 [Brucella sp. BO2]MRN79503.1 DUF2333 family protein [Brucella sp. 10RB9210]QPN28869.1 DUF2333 family protein [Brucella sp. BO2]
MRVWDAVRGIFSFLGRFIAALARLIAVPLGALWRLFLQLGTLWKAVVAIVVIGLGGLYVYFIWQTQVWTNFNPDYPAKYSYQDAATPGEEIKAEAPLPLDSEPAPADADNPAPAGQPVQAAQIPSSVRKCSPSAIAEVAADLTDFNVNQNAWISSMLLYKLGFFGLDWDRTPFLDNKASFQRGINAAVRRTAIELVDNIGRLRGTSQIDGDLQKARGNLQFAEDAWYFGLNPFGPKTPTPSYYRSAIKDLRAFNGRLENCQATFDARADNLIQFVDRIASDLGSTSAILKDRAENYHAGWFDTRADDRFWFAYGQLYAYYGLLRAAHSDFRNVLAEKHLDGVWDEMEKQLRDALDMQPFIVSNGNPDAWITPSHLTTMGFYILRVRSNLVDVKQVLER